MQSNYKDTIIEICKKLNPSKTRSQRKNFLSNQLDNLCPPFSWSVLIQDKHAGFQSVFPMYPLNYIELEVGLDRIFIFLMQTKSSDATLKFATDRLGHNK